MKLRRNTHSAASSENRIRQFCVEALAASDDTVLDEVLPRLQAALAEHIHNAHIRAAEEIPQIFKPLKNAA
jgi:hypothetical protein